MPIRPENRARYPKDWPAISRAIRNRAHNRCEAEGCGVENHAWGWRDRHGQFHELRIRRHMLREAGYGKHNTGARYMKPPFTMTIDGWSRDIIEIVLTVAHLNHTPEDCRPENLKALCQRCHNRYDRAARRQGTITRLRAASAAGDLFEGVPG